MFFGLCNMYVQLYCIVSLCKQGKILFFKHLQYNYIGLPILGLYFKFQLDLFQSGRHKKTSKIK